MQKAIGIKRRKKGSELERPTQKQRREIEKAGHGETNANTARETVERGRDGTYANGKSEAKVMP